MTDKGKWRLIINENHLTITCNGKTTVYKNQHAFRTALTVWLMLQYYKEEHDYETETLGD